MARVHWIVPQNPFTVFTNGSPDFHFHGTVGWCWEEMSWAGEHTGERDILTTGLGFDAETIVLSPEGTVPPYLTQVLSLPPSVRLLLRCVGQPAENNDVWDAVSAICPRLSSVAVLSEKERAAFEPWARVRGFKGTVRCIPLGAKRCFPSTPKFGEQIQRQGVAFLGRPFWEEKGIGMLLEAAKRLPSIPFYFASPRLTDIELQPRLQAEAAKLPNVKLLTCGIQGRESLLRTVRIAAVRGLTDWQWLPGTEIRGAYGVGLAQKGTPVEAWNGDGLAYFTDVDNLVEKIRLAHINDAAFYDEATRQHEAFLKAGLDSTTVGKKFWEWVSAP